MIKLIIYLTSLSIAACSGLKENNGNVQNRFAEKKAALQIEIIGKIYTTENINVPVKQVEANMGGSTSVRNTQKQNLVWKQKGYFQRNRDLGQVFTINEDFILNAVILRTGPSDKGVLAGTQGSKVFIQFFEVSGIPVINDNGTPEGTKAKHGFSTVHRCDDFIEGVDYKTIFPVYEGIFPAIPSTFEKNKAVNGDDGKLVYMRWKLAKPFPVKKGKKYAFMVGFSNPGASLGFTLANYNTAAINAKPDLEDEHDLYKGGWGFRREGDGTNPPTMIEGENPPTSPEQLNQLVQQALFATGNDRYKLKPTTDGYPDVDTYRNFEFYLETK